MIGTSVQTLDIFLVGRVEGDLGVRVDIEHGQVVNAWLQAELFLRGDLARQRSASGPRGDTARVPDLWRIAPDMRGLGTRYCVEYDGAAQREPRRNLGQIVDTLRSHPRPDPLVLDMFRGPAVRA